MIAQMSQVGEVAVISLNGRLDIEKAAHLKKVCFDKVHHKKVIFCLQSLHFVGSSGIQNLFQMMGELKTQRGMDIKVSGMNADLQRLWVHCSKDAIEFHESLDKAVQSFQMTQKEII